MSQIVKTIKGRKYAYEVKWYPQQKKQIWTYQGKVEEKIDQVEVEERIIFCYYETREGTKER